MIDQRFDPKAHEQRIYKRWEDAGCFRPSMDTSAEPYGTDTRGRPNCCKFCDGRHWMQYCPHKNGGDYDNFLKATEAMMKEKKRVLSLASPERGHHYHGRA